MEDWSTMELPETLETGRILSSILGSEVDV